MSRLLLVIGLLALNGCAYYNGMYNANRLAGRAEKAERDGRTFDANSYWGQVIVKADSVLARHPDSKWADDARLLRGRGLARLGRCEAAIPELTRAQLELVEPDLVEIARLELGRCRLATGDVAGAQSSLEPLQESTDPARRRAAQSALGRARIAAGDYAGALSLLATDIDSTVAGNRLVALAGAGRLDDAQALADTLIVARDITVPWGHFLRELGASDPASASAYLDRIAALPLDAGQLAAWLVDDANRRLAGDFDGAMERLADAARRGPDSEAGNRARELRVRLVLGRVAVLESLQPAIDTLRGAGDDVPIITPSDGLLQAADVIQRVADSATERPPHGDLMLFLAAELARDSLGASALAADLMRRVAADWPASPYAPKALLAVMALDQEAAAAARADLEDLYGASPYVLVAQGLSDSSYHVLEDSLGSYAVAWRAAVAGPVSGRGVARPADRQPVRPTATSLDAAPNRRQPRRGAGVVEP